MLSTLKSDGFTPHTKLGWALYCCMRCFNLAVLHTLSRECYILPTRVKNVYANQMAPFMKKMVWCSVILVITP